LGGHPERAAARRGLRHGAGGGRARCAGLDRSVGGRLRRRLLVDRGHDHGGGTGRAVPPEGEEGRERPGAARGARAVPRAQMTSKLAIIIMSSCSRLWQWKTYLPR